ncbi:hypothetical protein FDI26_gp67 [Arthrobacter phage Beans]|uniref:Uncharacterized protein n=1 Tax=Arthrobacter phage Beans TaxID=2015815 RepID=A0A222ZL27_9CAUD|nr:hypothetical protein FDI26_gp67 [Arthrobacter phage Beans]ASR84740.1 hypothetical protein SEA_BEANS_67 [Arthrobacter phage Beans]
MSDATLQAVHDAVAAHVADESGGTDWLTEWVCIAVAVPQDDYEQCSMADYTGAVWILGTHIDKAGKELDDLLKKREDAKATLDLLDRQIVQKGDEIGDFKDARDLLMNPPAEPVEDDTPEPDAGA